jgi:hypothetical protein
MTNMRNDEASAAVGAWFGQRLPAEWTATAPSITVDREEIVVILALDLAQDTPAEGDDAAAAAAAEALAGFIARFREETRERRIGIAREAEHRYQRKVAWGVRVGEHEELFTHLAVPVMTRLRQPDRRVLDTLVDAGVARSRAHALAWCVRLVGDNASSWLGELREAMEHVDRVRQAGPAPQDS